MLRVLFPNEPCQNVIGQTPLPLRLKRLKHSRSSLDALVSSLLTQDPHVHLKNLKPSPVASPLVDACIECGFCESNCPSRDVTLTPRQRITSFREMSRLEGLDTRTAEEEERCAFLRFCRPPPLQSVVVVPGTCACTR